MKTKTQYRIRNWPAYNAALIGRGSLTLWVDEAALEAWRYTGPTQRGAQYVYAEAAISCVLTLRAVYHLALRATEGFARSVFALLEVALPVPSYSTLSRRAAELPLALGARPRSTPLHLVIDSSGFKVYGEGEWKVRQGETVRGLCEAYLERHASRKRSAYDDRRRITQHLIPAWGHRKTDSITRADVAALHTKIGQRATYEANRTVALLSKIFELARRWGFVPENAANPARGIDKFKEQKRDRWVKPEEMPRLAAAIAQDPNLYARAAIWLYLLTGVRKTELLKALWAD